MQFFVSYPFFMPAMHVVFTLCYATLAAFLLVKDGRAKVHQLCALVLACFMIWCLGKIISHYPHAPPGLADFSRNVVVTGAWTFSSFLFLFALALTGRDRYLAKKTVWAGLFFIPVFSICLQWFSGHPLSYVSRSFGWGLSWDRSVWTLLLLGHIFITTCLSGVICLFFGFRCTGRKRRIRSLLIGSCILGGMVIGYGTNFLIPYFGLDFPDLAQNIAIFWTSGVVYAVIRYDSLVLNPEIASRQILATLSDALFLTDPGGKILTVNNSGLSLLGFQPRELSGRNIKTLFPPGQWDAAAQFPDRSPLTDRDMQMKTKSGRRVNVGVSVTILDGNRNRPGGMIVVARDIEERLGLRKALQASHDDLERRVADRTGELSALNERLVREVEKRKAAAAALKESEEMFRLISEQSLLGILILQKNRVVYCNEAWEKMSGFTEKEILQWDPNQFVLRVHPDDREHMLAQAQKKQMGETDFETRYDWRLFPKGGGEKWIAMYSRPIPYRGGLADLASMIDITEQKNLFFSLQESEEKYRLLIENANDAIFILQDGLIQFVNQKASDIMGYAREELLSKPFIELVHPDDRKETFARYERRIAGEEIPANQSFSVLHKSGDVLWIQNSAVRIKWNGRDAVLSFARDLTREKKIEDMMNHAHRLSAVGNIAGGIAHDFNNMLSPILGYAEIMAQDLEHDAENRERANQIITAAMRGRELIQQILTFSRHKAFELKAVDVAAVARETVKLNRAILPKHIVIEDHVDPDCGAVMADSTQLHQVMMNIITNAQQAMMDDGGTIRISVQQADHFRLADDPDQAYIRFKVEDTGDGMDPETLEKIFDPYFTTKAQGSGLGLPIAMAIIKGMDGYIDVTSRKGSGTRVDIHMPACSDAVENYEPEIAPDPSAPVNGNVMLIDDEPEILRVYGQILERIGYRVERFNDPEPALEAFEKAPGDWDLVITDMSMPGISGETVARAVLKDRPGLPVILCTGYTDAISQEEAAHIGIRALLTKPVAMKSLVTAVQSAVSDPRPGDEHPAGPGTTSF